MRFAKSLPLACTALSASPTLAEDDADQEREAIVVTGTALESGAATKTDVPAIQVPQPVTVIPEEIFTQQGAVSVSDTLNYVAGVQANPYGPDSRVDGGTVRGINALQFRDGMRDVFSYYASIRSDPYNFSSVQVVRGPAVVMFGAGSLGGIINLNSKMPEFSASGEVSLRYGSFDRKEVAGGRRPDRSPTTWRAASWVARARCRTRRPITCPTTGSWSRRRLPSRRRWTPRSTLLGLYQEDDSGSTSQFLPLVGTLLPNPNGQLPSDLFVGKAGSGSLRRPAAAGHRARSGTASTRRCN